MSADETFILLVNATFILFFWGFWYSDHLRVHRLASARGERLSVLLSPVIGLALLNAILQIWASYDVRDSPVYLTFYTVLGAGWLGLALLIIPYFGLDPRGDVTERRNPAAAHATTGAILGITLCFAGGNIGDGPGWWVVYFAALLSTGAFFLAWAIVERFTDLADNITIERDRATGLRLAGFLVGIGLVFGRSVAGDWVSAAATVNDFLQTAWPALVLVILAIVFENMLRPTMHNPHQPLVTHGLLPMALFTMLGLFAARYVGPW